MQKLFLILLGVSLYAQTVVVDPVKKVSSTQALIHSTVTNSNGTPYTGSPCTVRASEGDSFGTLVHDVDPTLFSGSNLDNRDGAVIDGANRWFTLGTRTASPAASGFRYSRSLQAATNHIFGITCGGASEVVVHFQTGTIPLGNTFPEAPQGDATNWNGIATPDVDLTNDAQVINDPLTGVSIQRGTAPNDLMDSVGTLDTFSAALDLSGGAGWTSIANANHAQSSSVFASVSVANSAIFLPFPPGLFDSTGFAASAVAGDIRLRSFLRSTNGGTLSSCITVDSGNNCATSSQDTTGTGTFGELRFPSSGYPSPFFSAWGNPTFDATLINTTHDPITVSASAHALTTSATFMAVGPGAKLLIPGTSPSCTNNLCTVSVYNNHQSITLVENVATPVSGVAMTYENAGLKVWLKATGGSPSVDVNFTFDWAMSGQYFSYQDSSYNVCNMNTLSVSTDASGNPITPVNGYLCMLGPTANYSVLILWVPSRRERRLMSSFYNGTGFQRYNVTVSPFDTTNANAVYASDGAHNLWKGVLNSTLPYVPDYSQSNQSVGNLTWTEVGTAASLTSQMASYPGVVGSFFNSGLVNGTTMGLQGFVGGYAYYRVQAGQDWLCIQARVDPSTFTVLDAKTSFAEPIGRWGGCHVSAFGDGTWMDVNVNPIRQHNTSAAFGGPFRVNITALHHTVAGFQSASATATAAKGTVTTITSTASGLDPSYGVQYGVGANVGPYVTISGATACTGINSTWVATWVDYNTFTVPFDSSGCASITGSLSFTSTPPLVQLLVGNPNITTGTPAVVTVTSNSQYAVPAAHYFKDGDSITFVSDDPTGVSSYYAKATGYPANQFAIYTDSALTHPVNGAALPLDRFGQIQLSVLGSFSASIVYYAEDCPSFSVSANYLSQSATYLPFDSGANGRRCIQVQTAGDPCSLFPGTGEHAAYPCPSDPSNAAKSSLQTAQPGDMIQDLGMTGSGNLESLILVGKTGTSTLQTWTLMRWCCNLLRVDGAMGDNHASASRYNHQFGATFYMAPSSPMSWVNALDGTHTWIAGDPNFTTQHADFGYGNGANLYTFAPGMGQSGSAIDSIPNLPFASILSKVNTYTESGYTNWNNSTAPEAWALDQSYPGHRQKNATTAADFQWAGDWQSLNPSAGGQGIASGANPLAGGMSAALVAGTSHVYKVSNVFGAMDRKNIPTFAWAGKMMLRDVSGPGVVITDAMTWTYCIADLAGDCRPGSAKGDAFMVLPIFFNSGVCYTNTYDVLQPCLINLNSKAGWAVQSRIEPNDTVGTSFRKLTLGLAAPAMHFTYQNWLQSPDGGWGFFSAPYVGGKRNDVFIMKLPPWPSVQAGRDDIDRSSYFPFKVQIPQFSGATYARIRFGYKENGPSTSLFCNTRQETCSNEIPSGSPTDPYSWLSEAVTRISCSGGCTETVPSIPGRVLYYVIDWLDGSGSVMTSSNQRVAIPLP